MLLNTGESLSKWSNRNSHPAGRVQTALNTLGYHLDLPLKLNLQYSLAISLLGI